MRLNVVKLGICALLITTVAACGGRKLRDDGLRFDGERFRINAKQVDRDNRQDFTVAVSPVSRSFDGARAAAHYGGTQYCIENFGTSSIKWVVAPDADGVADLINGDSLTLSGQCRP